jgi:hypothetical protein
VNDPNARELSAEVRAKVGIPRPSHGPYRWTFAVFFVAIAAGPLALAGLFKLALLVTLGGLVVWPAIRWTEDREALARERTFKTGQDTIGRVMAVEPGDRGRGHIVRVEFEAGSKTHVASVQGCPLARHGLMPGEDVAVRFDPTQPLRCLILGRSKGGSGRPADRDE